MRLVRHICVGYVEEWEKLDDDTSLILKLIKRQDANQLSEIVRFFWTFRDKLTNKVKAKIRPLWKALFELLYQKKENPDSQKIISNLSRWLSLIDEIDQQTLEWLKVSARYIEADFNATLLIEYLSRHALKTPEKVAEIYLEMLSSGVYPDYDTENTEKIVQILYEKGHKESADRICNMYGTKGFDFLRPMYEKYRTVAS